MDTEIPWIDDYTIVLPLPNEHVSQWFLRKALYVHRGRWQIMTGCVAGILTVFAWAML